MAPRGKGSGTASGSPEIQDNFVSILLRLGRRKAQHGVMSEEGQKLMDYALRAITARAYSEAELRARLLRRSDEEAAERVIARLRELGYLNDAELARHLGQRRGLGQGRLRAQMQRRGLASDVIEEALEGRDPQQDLSEARELLRRRLPTLLSGKNARSRAYGLLARRGYSGDIIARVMAEQTWPVERPSWGRSEALD